MSVDRCGGAEARCDSMRRTHGNCGSTAMTRVPCDAASSVKRACGQGRGSRREGGRRTGCSWWRWRWPGGAHGVRAGVGCEGTQHEAGTQGEVGGTKCEMKARSVGGACATYDMECHRGGVDEGDRSAEQQGAARGGLGQHTIWGLFAMADCCGCRHTPCPLLTAFIPMSRMSGCLAFDLSALWNMP